MRDVGRTPCDQRTLKIESLKWLESGKDWGCCQKIQESAACGNNVSAGLIVQDPRP